MNISVLIFKKCDIFFHVSGWLNLGREKFWIIEAFEWFQNAKESPMLTQHVQKHKTQKKFLFY